MKSNKIDATLKQLADEMIQVGKNTLFFTTSYPVTEQETQPVPTKRGHEFMICFKAETVKFYEVSVGEGFYHNPSNTEVEISEKGVDYLGIEIPKRIKYLRSLFKI